MGNYYLYQFARFCTRILPLRVCYFFASLLAVIHCLVSRADHRAVENNLKSILNRTDVPRSLVCEVFSNFAKYMVDFFTMRRRIDKNFIAHNVEIRNIEAFNKVLKEGKGGLLVSAHLGNWEMAGAVLSMMGYPLSVVALTHQDPRVNAIFNNQREYFGITVIPPTVAVRRCLDFLKNNKLVAIIADRDFTSTGIRMPFLNRETMIPKGAALFSFKTGAPLVPTFLTMEGDRYIIHIDEPIYPPVIKGEITEEIVKSFIQKYLTVMEGYITRYPTQWLMFREYAL